MAVELMKPVEGNEGIQVLNVTFFEKITPVQARAIMKAQLEICVSVMQPSNPILTAVWDADGNPILPAGEKLIYDAKTKKTMTMDEYRGVVRGGEAHADYFLETEEGKTLAGIKPERRWVNLTIVYPKSPAIEDAYRAAIAEAEKAAAKGLDVNLYVSVGDKGDRASWKQLKDPAGGYVFVNYDSKTKRIVRQGKMLKQLE